MLARVYISSVIAAALLLLLSCAPTHTIKLQEEWPSDSLMSASAEKPLSIVAYTTRDGVHTEFAGTVICQEGQCTFRPHSNVVRPFTLSRDQIESFDVIGTTKSSRTAVFVLVIATVVGVIYLMALSGAGEGWGL
jgi:hypothetical protein